MNIKENTASKRTATISDPTPSDVLCGRGARVNAHGGNIRFRHLIHAHKIEYLKADTNKAKIVSKIVSMIRNLDPPDRFLKQDTVTGLWEEIGDAKAKKKTGQAFREGSPNLHINMEKEKRKDAIRKEAHKLMMSQLQNLDNIDFHHQNLSPSLHQGHNTQYFAASPSQANQLNSYQPPYPHRFSYHNSNQSVQRPYVDPSNNAKFGQNLLNDYSNPQVDSNSKFLELPNYFGTLPSTNIPPQPQPYPDFHSYSQIPHQSSFQNNAATTIPFNHLKNDSLHERIFTCNETSQSTSTPLVHNNNVENNSISFDQGEQNVFAKNRTVPSETSQGDSGGQLLAMNKNISQKYSHTKNTRGSVISHLNKTYDSIGKSKKEK